MPRLSKSLRVALFLALSVCVVAPAIAQSRRPTPREAIERNIAPLTAVVRELALSDAERAAVSDVTDRAEAWAAEMVEAEHHRDPSAVRARARRIELLARVVRARVEALRANATAAERERAVVSSNERRTQARASLERAAEERLVLERGDDAVSTYTLPPPDSDASARAADAAAEASR
jgi:membrane-bound lytic murein transglycosylase